MKIPLPELVEIRTGYQFRQGVKDETPDGAPVRVIQLKDIEGGRLHAEGLERVRARPGERHQVRPKDVLLLMRGRRFTATLVDVPLEDTIATHFFFVLRSKTDALDPAYLAWFLNHPQTQEELVAHAHTTHIPIISRGVVENLTIEVPPLEIQRAIVALNQLKTQEAQLCAQLLEKRAQFVNALTLELARQDLKP